MQMLSLEERQRMGKCGPEKILETYELSKAAETFWLVHAEVLKKITKIST
jgi:hypothetical protein